MKIEVNDLSTLRDNIMIIKNTEIHDMEIQKSLIKCL